VQAEAKRVVFKDTNTEKGFFLVVDQKWVSDMQPLSLPLLLPLPLSLPLPRRPTYRLIIYGQTRVSKFALTCHLRFVCSFDCLWGKKWMQIDHTR
jgi:hypothetical protein